MLSYFKNKSVGSALNFKSIENSGKSVFELNVHDGSNNLANFSNFGFGFSFGGGSTGETGSIQSSF